MKFNNDLSSFIEKETKCSNSTKLKIISDFTSLLSPLAPHISYELSRLFLDSHLIEKEWPKVDVHNLQDPFFELVIQINGKKKFTFKVPSESEQKYIEEICYKEFKIEKEKFQKIIFVKNKLINFVGK